VKKNLTNGYYFVLSKVISVTKKGDNCYEKNLINFTNGVLSKVITVMIFVEKNEQKICLKCNHSVLLFCFYIYVNYLVKDK
jgi:hypothetical protein